MSPGSGWKAETLAVEISAVQTVRSYYQLVDAQDVESICNLFAPDGIYRRPGYPPVRGREALRRFFAVDRVIASGRHQLTRLVHSRNVVAAEGGSVGRLKDGQDITARFADFWEFTDDGLVLERSTYFDAPLI